MGGNGRGETKEEQQLSPLRDKAISQIDSKGGRESGQSAGGGSTEQVSPPPLSLLGEEDADDKGRAD